MPDLRKSGRMRTLCDCCNTNIKAKIKYCTKCSAYIKKKLNYFDQPKNHKTFERIENKKYVKALIYEEDYNEIIKIGEKETWNRSPNYKKNFPAYLHLRLKGECR